MKASGVFSEEIETKFENVEEVKKKEDIKKKVLICGLLSGIVTKTIFAPFDRIRLFYQIQPMFQHYHVKKKSKHTNRNGSLNFFKNTEKYIQNNKKKKTKTNEVTRFFQQISFNKKKKRNVFALNRNIVFDKLKKVLTEVNIQPKGKIGTTHISSNCYSRIYSKHKILKHIYKSYKETLNCDNAKTCLYKTASINKNWRFYRSNNFKRIIKNKKYNLNNKDITNISLKYKNIVQSFFYIIKEEGILGLWRGNLINTIRGGFVYSAKFGTNDLVKETYRKGKNKDSQPGEKEKKKGMIRENEKENEKEIINISQTNNKQSLTEVDSNRNKKINYKESIVAGYTAGIIQKTISYPLDLLSIRMALGVNEKYLRYNMYKKKSIFKLIHEIITKEGFSGFFKGLCPTLLTGVPYVTLQMFLFDYYKNIFQNTFPSPFSLSNDSLMYTALYSSLSGSLSNLTTLIIVFPGDTVRKRMMNNGIGNKNFLYKNSFDCIKYIYYKEGFKNFYFGLFPSILKAMPSGAIQFLSYEILKHLLTQE